MRFFVCLGTTFAHPLGDEATAAARTMSRPDTVVATYFNGTPLRAVPSGVEAYHSPTLLGQERGLWRWAFAEAQQRKVDWCVLLHDDFLLRASGWEAEIEAAAATYRIGFASWAGYGQFLVPPNSVSEAVSGALAACADGCGLAFNMACYAERGCFAQMDAICGLGDMEACAYAISTGWAGYGLSAPSHHHGGVAFPNARSMYRLPMDEDSHRIAERYSDLFPIRCVGDTVVTANGSFGVRL